MSIISLFLMLSIATASAATEELVEASVGTTVTFSCQIGQDSNTVVWRHYPIGAKIPRIVYLNGAVFEAYQSRFSVTGSRIGESNLTIFEVNLGDSAKYTCTVEQQIHSFELVVLELYPSPQSCASNSSNSDIIGRNSCGIEPDVVSLMCTLRYQGNVRPYLEWNSTISNLVAPTEKTIDNRTTVSTLILKADEQKSATYTCRVKYLNSNLQSRFSWSLEINITTLFNKTRRSSPDCSTKSVACPIDTTTDCAYTWTNNKSAEVDSGSILSLKNLPNGEYTCKANCVFRKEHRCSFESIKVNYTCFEGKNADASIGIILGIVFGVMVIIVTIAIASIFVYRKIRKKGPTERINVVLEAPTCNDEDSAEKERLKPETDFI